MLIAGMVRTTELPLFEYWIVAVGDPETPVKVPVKLLLVPVVTATPLMNRLWVLRDPGP